MYLFLYYLYVAMAKDKIVTTDETVEGVDETVEKVVKTKKVEEVKIVCKKTGTPLTIDTKNADILIEKWLYLSWEEAVKKEEDEMLTRADGLKVRTWEILRQPIVYTVDKTWEPILIKD